jgi:cyclophilin family peptidyl-prolyl cis-trans isomerase
MADRKATFETNKGTFVAQLNETQAPITAGNFIHLAEKGFYDGLAFHRYVENFVIQGGDPDGDGTGGSGKNIPLEIVPELKHDQAGVMSMARSAHPDSASSQFYFTLKATPHLDGAYAVFGRVVSGLDVVLSLREGDRMQKVTIGD